MEVVLYFDESQNLKRGFKSIQEVSKNIGKVSLTLATRENMEFTIGNQTLYAVARDELKTLDFDYLILCDMENFSSQEICANDFLNKIPLEKIFTPAQFIKKFSVVNPPPPNYYSLLMQTQDIMSSLRSILFLRSCRIPKLSSKLFSPTTNILQNTTQTLFNSTKKLIPAKSATPPLT